MNQSVIIMRNGTNKDRVTERKRKWINDQSVTSTHTVIPNQQTPEIWQLFFKEIVKLYRILVLFWNEQRPTNTLP